MKMFKVTWRYSKICAMNMVFYSGVRSETKNCLHSVFWVPVCLNYVQGGILWCLS